MNFQALEKSPQVFMNAGPQDDPLFLPDPGEESGDLLRQIGRVFRSALRRFRRLDPAIVADSTERIAGSVIRGNIRNVTAVVGYRLNRDLTRREIHRREHEAIIEPSILEQMAGADPDSLSFAEELERESLTAALKDRMDPETRELYLLVAQGRSLARIAKARGTPKRTLTRHFQQGLKRAVDRLKRDSENARRLK